MNSAFRRCLLALLLSAGVAVVTLASPTTSANPNTTSAYPETKLPDGRVEVRDRKGKLLETRNPDGSRAVPDDGVPDPTPTPSPLQVRVREAKPLPAPVRARTPRGSETLFYGVAPIGARGSEVLLHVYQPLSKEGSSGTLLDIFTRRAGAKSAPLTQHTIRLGDTNKEDFALVVRWLYPRRKSGPVLIATLTGGAHRVFTFAHGIEGPVAEDSFTESFSLNAVRTYDFNTLDRRGMMAVREMQAENNGEAGAGDQSFSLLPWNGRHFAASASASSRNHSSKTKPPARHRSSSRRHSRS